MKYVPQLVLALVVTLAACANVPTATFNDKVVAADRSVQLVQTSATSLLTSGQITKAQDQVIQAQVKLVHESIVLAKSLQSNDPTKATAQLTAALEQLDALKKQTGVSP